MKYLLLLGFLLVTTCVALAQTGGPKDDLKAYYFVLLHKGPHRDQDSVTEAKIQKEHLANINKLAQEGKLTVAGPFLDEGNLMGIFIFDVSTEEEVKQMVDNDPAVKAGRLTYEIHPWMTQKGTCFK